MKRSMFSSKDTHSLADLFVNLFPVISACSGIHKKNISAGEKQAFLRIGVASGFLLLFLVLFRRKNDNRESVAIRQYGCRLDNEISTAWFMSLTEDF